MTLIDRLFSLSTPNSGVISEDNGILEERNLSDGGKEAWSLLRRLRKQAWESVGRDPDILWIDDSLAETAAAARPAFKTNKDPVKAAVRPPEDQGITAPGVEASFNLGTCFTSSQTQPFEQLDFLLGSDPMQFDWIDWDAATMVRPPDVTGWG